MRQYSLVLFCQFLTIRDCLLDSRLISRACSGDHFIVVVEDREKCGDNGVASSGILDVFGTVLVDLRLSVGESLVRAHGSAIGT